MKLTEQQIAKMMRSGGPASAQAIEDFHCAAVGSAEHMQRLEELLNDPACAQALKLSQALAPWSRAVAGSVENAQGNRFARALGQYFKPLMAATAMAAVLLISQPLNRMHNGHVTPQAPVQHVVADQIHKDDFNQTDRMSKIEFDAPSSTEQDSLSAFAFS